ncbi:MAG TPA: glycosyltransferase [Anaerolineales bacterium]|nr:glycosyltransferase [Anaerolineales bacterium]
MSNVATPVQKYRIAFLIDGLSMGGAERLMVPILKHLSRAHFEPYVCAMQTKDGNPMADEIRALGVPVECLNIKHLRELDAIPRLTSYLKSTQADLVHTQLEAANILGNISAKLLRLPSVCTIHVMPSLDVKTKTKLHQKVEWFTLRHFCDRVIAVSEEARQYHVTISGAPNGQVKTIYNGIDLTTFSNMDLAQERRQIRAELGIPPEADVLVTVAVLRPPKGIQFLIRAMPAILASHSKAYYLIVGSGSHRDALVEEVSRAGVNERVIFAGMRKDVPRLLAASDIFVLPTLTEALPTVLAEAMAARLPIIASRVGGIPEMIAEGQNGILIEPEDQESLSRVCIRLLKHQEERAAMGAEGWMIVNQKFSIQRQVEQLKDLYVEQLRAYGKS